MRLPVIQFMIHAMKGEDFKKLELRSRTTHSQAKRPDSKQQEPPKRLMALATPSSSRTTKILAPNYHIHYVINL